MARILLVDDDVAMRSILERTLVAVGHTVVQAVNGTDALEILRSQAFDLVLTDLVMPDGEGLQLLRDIRKMSSGPKSIAMSGGGRGSAQQYLELADLMGATETLEKPFTPQVLLAAIQRVLGPQSIPGQSP